MAAGWAVALDAPFTWTKQVASSFGGTRNGLVVHWPKGIKAKGELRTQFHHVIDVAPTVLEAAKLPEPKIVIGTPQIPMEGVSTTYSFDDGKAKDRHVAQYFEVSGNGPSTMTDGSPGRFTGRPGSRSRAVRSPRTSGNSTTSAPTSA